MSFSKEQTSELQKKLDPAHVKPPAPGKYGNYIEGWHAIAEANRIFGFDGWSYSVKSVSETNCLEKQDGKWAVGYIAVVSVTAGGVTREDAGHGQGHGKSLGDAYDSAIKEAVTDGLKRALRSFGNPFGLALYDKSHANVGVDIDWATERDDLTRMIQGCQNLDDLVDLWKTQRFQHFLHQAPEEFSSPVIQIKDRQKQTIQQVDQAA
ncbi:RAD52 family DNA repair protein [uncultured Roseibium sp.]|uniref:RAD52 family DNA repair protein n=1 Tax=uncultured Roseibium sp. TaxID=1936171 RepID=UPI0026184873|nr:RAD52 family DNA repair protein [uncultured Roseibium sp.]